ncbi:MAG: LCP family protein [Lachnospiraceae bacterium]|nr:LCP family protein [Lachnospiraceae bacterium]
MNTKGSGKHHRHRHHRHGVFYRIRRWIRHNKKWFGFCSLMIIGILGIGSYLLYGSIKRQSAYHVISNNSVDVGTGYRNITYNGQEYQYNNLITTILVIGIDSTGSIERTGYTAAPRADSINLVVLDEYHSKVTIVAFNRSTQTAIHRYTLGGTDRGTYVTYLCYAYTYGDGLEASCENVVTAIEDLLGGIQIDDYITTNVSALPYINSLVGGVTVTVPNDDLVDEYPELSAGSVVTLDDSNIEAFLRSRDTNTYFSNDDRMERQSAFMTAYAGQFKTCISEDLEGMWTQIEQFDEYALTSITKSQYISLANLLGSIDFEEVDYYTPEGEDVVGNYHDEFYIDEDAWMEKIIELFYIEQ